MLLQSVIAAGYFAFIVEHPLPNKTRINSFDQAPWLASMLIAYVLGTLVTPFKLVTPEVPVPKTLKSWGLLLPLAEAAFLVPLALAPRFGWDADDCLSVSLLLVLLPMAVGDYFTGHDWRTALGLRTQLNDEGQRLGN